MKKITELDQEKTKKLTIDARLLAMRWDLIPWCLVLDLDVPVSEAADAPLRRAWIVFEGISELYLPLLNARLPNGCGLISQITIEKLSDNFQIYKFWGLLPSFSDDDSIHKYPSKEISIKAKEMSGFISIEARPKGKYLERKSRISLASDDELLSAFISTRSARKKEPEK